MSIPTGSARAARENKAEPWGQALRSGAEVIDLGCGPGAFLPTLSDLTAVLLGDRGPPVHGAARRPDLCVRRRASPRRARGRQPGRFLDRPASSSGLPRFTAEVVIRTM